MCGSILELGEGLIDGEGLGDVLCSLCTDVVVPQTANGSQTQTSEGADSRKTMRGDLLEDLQGGVGL